MTIRIWRAPLLAAAMGSMAYGIWLGLLRLGWILPLPWPDQLILHGPLMVGGFLGTLISLERAIGLAKRWAYAGPIASATGALLLVFGPPGSSGLLLICLASAVVVFVFATIFRHRPSLFVITMLAGAMCWLIGNIIWYAGAAIFRVVFWWIAFVVLTIAGERLELNRILRPSAVVRATFAGAASLLIAGVVTVAVGLPVGALFTGVGLMAISAWFAINDVARRTIRQRGVTRYMAACLLAGYGWLAVAGGLLVATDAITPGTSYDAILHAIFVGFVISMIVGHAPVVFAAVFRVPLRHRSIAYVHLAVLHLSVAVRITGDLVQQAGRLRPWGALGNAAAIALFILVTTGSISIPGQPVAQTRA